MKGNMPGVALGMMALIAGISDENGKTVDETIDLMKEVWSEFYTEVTEG
jgi:hypothetical protein